MSERPAHNELGRTNPGDNIPETVIYYKLRFQPAGGTLRFFADLDQYYFGKHNFDQFLQLICSNQPAQWQKSMAPTPLDINVWEPAHVFVELDTASNWQFQPEKAGMLIEYGHKDDHCDLMHLMLNPDGTYDPQPVGGTAPGRGRCNMICFTSLRVPQQNSADRHCFNLLVQFYQDDNKVLPVILDPDIKNEGPPHPMTPPPFLPR